MRSACAKRLRIALSASIRNGTLTRDLAALSDEEIAFLSRGWQVWARDDQLPPGKTPNGETWRVWLILGGRGAGKTRAGAEWIKAKALGLAPIARQPAQRIALVGETIAEVRNVMVEGVSGLLEIHDRSDRPTFEPSKSQLRWPNGARAQIFSAENAESLRGPQIDAAWCDEIAKWRKADLAWDMLQLGLRLGADPQVAATTTPRPVPLLKRLLDDDATVVTRAPTSANKSNLAPTFVRDMERRFAGTALARQELLGEIISDDSGSLWRRDWIDAQRTNRAPELQSIVVAVDPPVTATNTSDACGVVVAARAADGRIYVLADRTVQGCDPAGWARVVVAAFQEFDADRVVAEVNQGGELVVSVLQQVCPSLRVRKVRATRGKWLRAEPVAALYAQGGVVHVGKFENLEDQMLAFGADGRAHGKSPDRLDALVWAVTDLMQEDPARPSVRPL